MLEMHRRGIIPLPAVKKHYAFRRARQAVAPPPLAAVQRSLAELGEVETEVLWRGMARLADIETAYDLYH